MQVYIAGTGKLANELIAQLPPNPALTVARWPAETGENSGTHSKANEPAIVVHAGSGRELAAISDFCARSGSTLVELSTGSALAGSQPAFPVVLCPNTNILMLKFMAMLARSGSFFAGNDIRLVESHQAGKTSVPGTAVAMADALGLAAADIVSVRNPAQQAGELGIPEQNLGRHAFHRIDITDGTCSLRLETRVVGDAPYASGVGQILEAVRQHPLQARLYDINEFIENGWL